MTPRLSDNEKVTRIEARQRRRDELQEGRKASRKQYLQRYHAEQYQLLRERGLCVRCRITCERSVCERCIK